MYPTNVSYRDTIDYNDAKLFMRLFEKQTDKKDHVFPSTKDFFRSTNHVRKRGVSRLRPPSESGV